MNTQHLELLPVCAELCAYLEKTNDVSKVDFIQKTQKLLALLYLKTSLIKSDIESDEYCEQFVTEDDWNYIQQIIEQKLGEHDSIITFVEPDKYETDEAVTATISECFADIYQDVRDFLERYKLDVDELRALATHELVTNFRTYWGPRLLAILTDFHNILYAADTTIFNETESEEEID